MTASTRQIRIGDQVVSLERRICDGGCGKAFDVLPTSPQRKARSNCEVVCTLGRTVGGSFFPPTDKTRHPVTILPRHQQLYNRVLAAMEEADARGESATMKELLPTLDLKVSDWNYTLIHLRTYKRHDLISRYRALLMKLQRNQKGDSVGNETVQLRAAMQSEDPPTEWPLREQPIHPETAALLKVIEQLRPLDKAARGRVMAAAAAMLEIS